MATLQPRYIRWFETLSIEDVPLVGGKNASLGEMYRALTPAGVRIPNGFAITAEAYRNQLQEAGIWQALRDALAGLNPADVRDLGQRAKRARQLVYDANLSPVLQKEILAAYQQLKKQYQPELSVAVRSSATAEDLPSASFAGQHETYLHIHSEDMLLDACRRCFASLFTERAIVYRIENGFDHFKVALSIGVMKMVRSDLASSGVMFSLDTESGFPDVVFINGAYGLGENVVKGVVDPDEFYVHKPTFKSGYRAVLRRSLGRKQIKMVYSDSTGTDATRNITTSETEQERFCINDDDVCRLAQYAIQVEDHYSNKAGHVMPMDMEWAKDGMDGELYLVQARPETVISQRKLLQLEEYRLTETGKVVVSGRAVGNKIAVGRARVICDVKKLGQFQPGEVLVSDITTPDWGPVMKTAAAIVTNRGGRTCHAAIVARELGIPAVVGAHDATQVIKSGDIVTVSCAQGDTGTVYSGELPFTVEHTDVTNVPRPRTKVMVNVGSPDVAFKTSFIPNDGVGLARVEFIISEYIRAHPMALLYPDKVADQVQRNFIEQQARQYPTASEYFVQRLSEGVGTIAAAFYPKPVIVRFSDFKSNEYASLVGGQYFEPVEHNPMLGFRGASRYTHPLYEQAFALECEAMKRAREHMGLTNIKLMIPFCRSVEEGERVIAAMAKHGLVRGDTGLEVYVMCEVPNNVVQIDAFASLFDGVSIGSNDLTQLLLGVDRDSALVAFEYNERDPGVLDMISQAVAGARRNGVYSGFCGQAPSDYPEVAEFLVRTGIDSISLNPDVVLKSLFQIAEIERRLAIG